jgi:hypothetical protein
MTGPSDSEAREFAASFQSFLQWVHNTDRVRSEVPDVVAAFLGDQVSDRSVVSR